MNRAVVLAGLLFLVGVTPLRNQTLQAHIEALIGSSGVNCGRLGTMATADAMQAGLVCAVDAARSGQPFYVVKDRQGIDSLLAQGLLAKAGGPILRFAYDSDPSGGSNSPETFTTEPCGSPMVVMD